METIVEKKANPSILKAIKEIGYLVEKRKTQKKGYVGLEKALFYLIDFANPYRQKTTTGTGIIHEPILDRRFDSIHYTKRLCFGSDTEVEFTHFHYSFETNNNFTSVSIDVNSKRVYTFCY